MKKINVIKVSGAKKIGIQPLYETIGEVMEAFPNESVDDLRECLKDEDTIGFVESVYSGEVIHVYNGYDKFEIIKDKELKLTAEDMMDIHHATVKLNAINDKIKELYNQKTKPMKRTLQDLADTLAKAIEDLKGLTNEKIPCPINMYIDAFNRMWIPFNNGKQVLRANENIYYVSNLLCSSVLSPCTLTPCKREDLKAGDVALCTDDDKPDFNEPGGYCVILNDIEYAWINDADVGVTSAYYDYWYKVEKI